MNTKKGFTLLELLIVIGILAILSTTIVLVINPAELLKKARDSQRISDLNTLKTAIAFYLSEGKGSIGENTKTYSHVSDVVCGGREAHTNQSQDITGGWVPINFTQSSGGSPISVLPVDPNASSDKTGIQYYVYTVDADKTFKLTANMESEYYSYEGSGDVESTDGGGLNKLYEIGTNLTLPPTGVDVNCFNGQGN